MATPPGIRQVNPVELIKSCRHPREEEIRNGNDVVVGGQCRSCLEVLWGIGKCSGCQQPGQKLRIVVQGKKGTARFCGPECQKLAHKYKRQESLYK